ncbi:MAG: methyltransferase [Clostridia bacterium]|nr:methyltransferase [Clostridia bacterium]
MLKHDERIDRVNEDILLIQKKNGLTFGTDALLLAAFVRRSPSSVALDFGAGSGIISFLCAARNKFKKIVSIEVQNDFYDIICRNIEINAFTEKVSAINADIRDLSYNILGFEADVIFSNPPYMRSGSGKQNENNEKAIARHEICGTIEDFCNAAAKNLKHGGLFYVVYRPERLTELFYAMRKAKIEPKRLCLVCPDADAAPSLILVEGKKGASAEIKLTKPLIMYKDKTHNEYTYDFQYIYDNGCFKEN